MLIPFCAFMYLIFGGADAGEEPGTGGINTTIPDGKVQRIEASRQKAAEKVEAEALAGNKIQSLGEVVSLPEPDSALRITTSLPAGGIDRSQDAHREMTRQIESFYSDPAPAPRTEELERELERLRGELAAKEAAESLARPDPMELVERQYALATKYFETPEKARTEMPAARGDRVPVTKVRRPPSRIVSTLARPSEDSAAAAENTPPRNSGFHTPVGASDALPANAIRACIAEDQTVNGDARLKLRLLEPLMAGETEVPENTVLYAAGRIDGSACRSSSPRSNTGAASFRSLLRPTIRTAGRTPYPQYGGTHGAQGGSRRYRGRSGHEHILRPQRGDSRWRWTSCAA